ncbi:MAG: serine hydrolase [Phycisphaerales bacterium]|nr:serine hydrolase [Phycisphaerales bacterium]
MKNGKHHLTAIMAMIMLLLSGAITAQITSPDVQSIIEERIEAGLTPAIAVGIVRKDGSREIFLAGTRHIGGDAAIDENTIFEIGSISKVFTGILLAQMIDEGTLGLSDSAKTYLPTEVTLSEDITLEHLATHTSGLPRMPGNFAPKDPSNPYADYTVEQMYECLSYEGKDTTVGGSPAYSNLGMGLLGHVLERRTGKDYETLMIELIAAPLNMNSTTIKPRPEDDQHVAGGHAGTIAVSAWDIPTLAGAGDINSTLNDMLIFTAANLGQLETDLYKTMKNSHTPRTKQAGGSTTIGLAWHVTGEPGREIIWHNGGTGGFASFMGVRPNTGEGVVVLSNASYRGVDSIGFHLLDSDTPLDIVRTIISVDPGILSEYVGTYMMSSGAIFTITLENDQLSAELTGQPSFPIFATSDDEFFYKVVDAQLTFLRNDDGQVDRLVLHQNGQNLPAMKFEQTSP